MSKIHQLQTWRAKQARIAGRFALAAIVATAVVIVGMASLTSVGDFSAAALGDANANTPATTPAEAAASTAAPSRGFDYFPDHYVNQAQEPAEPVATF
jgi:hypothetical protein